METKENYYWVVSSDNDGESHYEEGCHFFRVSSIEEAKRRAVEELLDSVERGFLELEEGQKIAPKELDCAGDAWAKLPAEGGDEFFEELAMDSGIDLEDVRIKRPGEHPCGDKVLVEVSARVFGAVVE